MVINNAIAIKESQTNGVIDKLLFALFIASLIVVHNATNSKKTTAANITHKKSHIASLINIEEAEGFIGWLFSIFIH